MELAETLEPEKQAAELILPTEHALDGIEALLEDLGVEERLAATFRRFPASRVRLDVGTMPRLKIAFRLRRQS